MQYETRTLLSLTAAVACLAAVLTQLPLKGLDWGTTMTLAAALGGFVGFAVAGRQGALFGAACGFIAIIAAIGGIILLVLSRF